MVLVMKEKLLTTNVVEKAFTITLTAMLILAIGKMIVFTDMACTFFKTEKDMKAN